MPGTLRYRPIAVRVVAEAARWCRRNVARDPDDPLAHDVRDPFDTAVVSAFMEIFNNVAIHAYKRVGGGTIEIALTTGTEPSSRSRSRTRASRSTSPRVAALPEELDPEQLPEGGMGIHIAKTMLDEIDLRTRSTEPVATVKRLPETRTATGS